MTHDIIDNRAESLVDVIRRILPGSQSAKFAVGYFFLSGLESVSDTLQNVGELRLLIGNTTNRETIEQIAEGYRRLEQIQDAAETQAYPKRVEQNLRTSETAREVGQGIAAMDQTDEAQRLAVTLIHLIEQGRLKVRVYTKGRLHAKAYIFDYGPIYDATGNLIPRDEKGLAIVGSSNFTLSGVSHNTELNVRVHGNENHQALTYWFTRLWDESQDFEEHLMNELRQSWPIVQVTPYQIYLKTMYELVKDRLDGEGEGEFIWQSEISAVLTDFQKDAVRGAVRMIREYGGCFVADVVGLGKSYIGAAIVKHFERVERARPLIICPAALQEMWEHYNETYNLNARVLPMSLLKENDENNFLIDSEKYRDRDFVLVDESHNFRNPDSQRYHVLQDFLQNGERKCVLLTATPRNKSAWDIYNQIHLFHPGDITFLPVDPPNLRDYFKQVEKGERALPPLLTHILIRRTRNEVLRWHGYDSETHLRVDPDNFASYRRGERRAYVLVASRKQYFPKRELDNIEYSIEAAYQGLYARLRGYLSPRESEPQTLPGMTIGDHLVYARYGLWHYVIAEKKTKPPYNELQHAGINLRGLMRVSLFKRLESSVEAFRKTIQRMVKSHEAFLKALDQGIVPAGEEAQRILYESDRYSEEDLYDALNKVCGRYETSDFMLAALREDIKHDLSILEKIYAAIAPITPAQDAKLQKLIKRLNEPFGNQPALKKKKCLIFTQYADTAAYLYEHLNPTRDSSIDVIYGVDKNKAAIVGRFSPNANPENRPKANVPEIHILIATDVLSEGLNLQDCDQVINYDLHWNPVRLIQRFGRVDRIGSEHDVIYAYNFLPETELDSNLGLRDKLKQRIQEIHDTIGEDAAILDPAERINEQAFYSIYQDHRLEETEEEDQMVDLNEATEIIRQLREDQPELFKSIVGLRDGIRSGYATNRDGTVVLCRAGSYRQLALASKDGEIVSRDIPRILSIMRCPADTPASVLPQGYNSTVMSVYKRFNEEVRSRKAEQSHTLALKPGQRYVIEEMQALLAETRDPDIQGQITLLTEAFQHPISEAVRRELNRCKSQQITGMGLLDMLGKIYVRYDLKARSERSQRDEDDLALIVCSEALVS